MIGWRQSIRRANMFMMGMGHDFGVMRRIIVAEDALPVAQISVGVTHANRIAELGADHFVKIEVRAVPENYPTANQAVEVIGCQASQRLLNPANPGVLSQTPFQRGKVRVDLHAETGCCTMNWRIGSEVK